MSAAARGPENERDAMRTALTAALIVGGLVALPVAVGAVPARGTSQPPAATSGAAPGSRAHPTKRARTKFRPSRAAAGEAKRLGAIVGQGCTGKADIQRNEHQWVVLCSNGKTYVVEPQAGGPTQPPVECALAGGRPGPACFEP
jgi:hypothetical protein